jgi:hypothetical protein
MVNSDVKVLVVSHLSFVINTVHAQKHTSRDIFKKTLFLLKNFYTFAFENRQGL